jgi:hypothetical protein
MKTLLLVILISILFTSNSFTKEITEYDFNPFNISFLGITSGDDKIIAYGDNGCIKISYKDYSKCETKKILKNGTIQKVFIDSDTIILFVDNGSILKSIDNGISFNMLLNIQESIMSVVKSADGYLIRTYNNLLLLDYSDKINKVKTYDSNIYKKYTFDKYINRNWGSEREIKYQILEDFTNSIVLFNGLYL